MSRWTIYTAIVGDIDTLVQPLVVDPRFDYVCFVRRGSGQQGVWELREIGEDIGDDRMLARYAKLHPCELLRLYLYYQQRLFLSLRDHRHPCLAARAYGPHTS